MLNIEVLQHLFKIRSNKLQSIITQNSIRQSRAIYIRQFITIYIRQFILQNHPTFDAKMSFEKHLRSVSSAAAQRLGIMRKSWQVFHDRSLLVRSFWSFVLLVVSIAQQCGAQLPTHTLNYWTELSGVLVF